MLGRSFASAETAMSIVSNELSMKRVMRATILRRVRQTQDYKFQ